MVKKNFVLAIWRKIKRFFIILIIAQFIYIVLLRWINPPITVTQLANLVEGYGLKRNYIDFDEMSPNIRLAVMASEDQLFPNHNGFDVESIKKALSNNQKKNKQKKQFSLKVLF